MMETEAVSELIVEKERSDTEWGSYYSSLEEELRILDVSQCPRCGSPSGQWRGYRERKKGPSVHKRCCKLCGRWCGV